MKVLQVTPFYPPNIGGIADHVYNITQNLRHFDTEITIVSPKRLQSQQDDGDCGNIQIYSIYLPPWPYPTLKNFSIPIDLGLRIDKIIRNGNFDLVHTHGLHYVFSWRAIYSAHKNHIPNIMTLHGAYSLNPYKTGGKTIIEEYFNKIVFSRLLARIDGVIGITEKTTNHARLFGGPNLNCITIPNGINLDPFVKNRSQKNLLRQKYRFSCDSTVVLFCGRFEHVKGILEFASAAKKIVNEFLNVEILVVGEGSLKDKVINLLDHCPRIHLLNWQPHDSLHEIYILSDVFVIPSRFEGLPITILEAMAASLHILYTPVGSLPEILEDYSSKTMIKESNTQEIYLNLKRVIGNGFDSFVFDYDLSEIIPFDWKNITLKIYQFYQSILESEHRIRD